MKRIMRAGCRLLVCLVAVFVLCGSGSAFAGGISGKVSDSFGAGIYNAFVEIFSDFTFGQNPSDYLVVSRFVGL